MSALDDDLLMGGEASTTAVQQNDADLLDELNMDEFMIPEKSNDNHNTATAAEEGAAENGDDDNTANNNAASSSSAATAVPTLADGRLVTALNKKQAKAELDKKEYKVWKKAMKALGGAGGGDSDDEDAGGGEKTEKKEKKDKSKKDKKSDKKEKKDKKKDKKRDREDDDEAAFAAEIEGLAGDSEALENAKRRRREKVKSRIAKLDNENEGGDGYNNNSYDGVAGSSSSFARRGGEANNSAAAKKMSKEERARINYAHAHQLVQKMAEARRLDTAAILKGIAAAKHSSSAASSVVKPAPPPINRLLIKDEVLQFARKIDNEIPLVKAGFLREIAFWILDGATGELPPLDLRNVAYEVLLKFGFKGSMDVTHPNRVIDKNDLTAWTGIGREELAATTLGKAVNTSRQHASETAENRHRAVTLLQRLSRAFSDEDDEEDGPSRSRGGKKGSSNNNTGGVHWPCEKDASIATPYEYITSSTEIFQNKVVQVDPLDPESYVRVPPLRIRKTPIR